MMNGFSKLAEDKIMQLNHNGIEEIIINAFSKTNMPLNLRDITDKKLFWDIDVFSVEKQYSLSFIVARLNAETKNGSITWDVSYRSLGSLPSYDGAIKNLDVNMNNFYNSVLNGLRRWDLEIGEDEFLKHDEWSKSNFKDKLNGHRSNQYQFHFFRNEEYNNGFLVEKKYSGSFRDIFGYDRKGRFNGEPESSRVHIAFNDRVIKVDYDNTGYVRNIF